MPPLTIQEPAQTVSITKAYGIDLGTTHSLIAIEKNGQAECILQDGQETLPSCIAFTESGEAYVGQTALEAFAKDAAYAYRSVKRLIGQEVLLNQPNGEVTPVELSAEILKTLVRSTGSSDAISAVITVPAYFNEMQRQQTRLAAKMANIKVLRLLNEPTAAAVAYGCDNLAKGCFLVFDLGGGTFDVSVLNVDQGVIEVIATNGDTQLGGDDIDQLLATWIIKQFPEVEHNNTLMMQARWAKEALSQETSVSFTVGSTMINLNRETLGEIIQPIISRLITICQRALLDAGVSIDAIICVGGASKIPMIQNCLQDTFKCLLKCELDPKTVVAKGAALQASLLSGHKLSSEYILLDVAPLSLGIETAGGLVERMIPRNTQVPVEKTITFTTQKDGQTAFVLKVVQGEREFAKDCHLLTQFTLGGLPKLPRGQIKLQLTFRLDRDGLLQIKANVNDIIETSKEIKPTYGMTKSTIERTIEGAISHATEDVQNRLLQEKREDAKEFAYQLERFIINRVSPEHLLLKSLSDFKAIIDLADKVELLNRMSLLEKQAAALLDEDY